METTVVQPLQSTIGYLEHRSGPSHAVRRMCLLDPKRKQTFLATRWEGRRIRGYERKAMPPRRPTLAESADGLVNRAFYRCTTNSVVFPVVGFCTGQRILCAMPRGSCFGEPTLCR